jgi:DNA replication and repair protein RecF
MRLLSLSLHHFRNHRNSSFEFGEGTNIFLGDNGEGKTNVIEAISYLCLTKSFYAGGDTLVLRFGEHLFEVEGRIVADSGADNLVRVAYAEPQVEKVFTINRKRVDRLSAVIGKFPVVICSPEHAPITMGAPGERRKFVDLVLSQSNAPYFHDLLEYRRVLKHRNRILLDARIARADCSDLIGPWDEQLVAFGARIIVRRKSFIDEFQSFMQSAYGRFVEKEEVPSIEYRPTSRMLPSADEVQTREMLRLELEERRVEERKSGTTLIGPQRDEFILSINGLELRKFASQGQHKTFLVALKMAEFFFLKDRCSETPILLLDDVFSELDEHRVGRVLRFVGDLSQTFITSTSPQMFETTVVPNERHRKFLIRHGTVADWNTTITA